MPSRLIRGAAAHVLSICLGTSTALAASITQPGEWSASPPRGYDFGPIKLQAYATTEVVEHNYGGRDTRGWLRMIVPIWTPEGCAGDASDHQGLAESALVELRREVESN